MANFLDTLRAWGESLFTARTKWAVQQTAPATIYLDTTVQVGSDNTCYIVAPIDGYVSVSSTGVEDQRLRILVSLNSDGSQTLLSGTAGVYPGLSSGLSFQVKKGCFVVVQYESNTDVNFRFVSATGGHY